MTKKDGFTLVEVLVMVVIIGVLAGLAVPSYFSTVEEARSNEAKTNLQIIRAGEKVFALNDANKNYWVTAASPVTVGAINTALSVDITTQFYNITSIANVGGNTKTFLATATRNDVQRGGATVRVFTINQNGETTP